VLNSPPYAELAEQHRTWLAPFDSQHATNWEKLFEANPENALAEAAIRRWLQQQNIRVEPNENLSGDKRMPDFRCFAQDYKFYVEVTNASIEEATKHSGLTDGAQGTHNYNLLTSKILNACKRKTTQLASLDAPGVLAYHSWHVDAASACLGKGGAEELLRGEASITMKFDSELGQAVGDSYQSTELKSAAFVRPEQESMWEHARQTISAILLCCPIWGSTKVVGALHPGPARPFDPMVLPTVPFASLNASPDKSSIEIVWRK